MNSIKKFFIRLSDKILNKKQNEKTDLSSSSQLKETKETSESDIKAHDSKSQIQEIERVLQESEIILQQIQSKDEIIPVNEKSQAPNCTYLFLDTETNSLSADRVVLQLAWITTDSKGTVCSEKSFYLNRKVYIDPGASRVNGITNDTLKKNGTPPEAVFNEFIKDLSNAEMLVAHNFSFDIQSLQNDFENFGLDLSLLDKPYICTMAWSKEYVQAKNRSGALKNPRLEEMAGLLLYGDISRTFPEAHDALFDTKLTKDCFFILKDLNTKGLLKNNTINNDFIVSNKTSYVEKYNGPICSKLSYFLPSSASSCWELDKEIWEVGLTLFKTSDLLQNRFDKMKAKLKTDNVAKFMSFVTQMSEDTNFSCNCDVCKWKNITNLNFIFSDIGKYRISFTCVDDKGNTENYATYLKDEEENGIDYWYKGQDFEKNRRYEDAISSYIKMLDYPCDILDLISCSKRLSILLFKLKRKDDAILYLNRILDKLKRDYSPALSNKYVKGAIDKVAEELHRRDNMCISETAKVFTDDSIKYVSDEELEAMDLSMIFEGKKVLITGNLFEIGITVREEGNELIQHCGGLPQKSLVKNLDFVVIGADFGPAKMAQIVDRQRSGSSMKCLTPKQFYKIVSTKNTQSQTLRSSKGKTLDQLSFELKTIQKYKDLSKQAINNGTASFNFTQEEFDYLKECKLVDDSMIKEKKYL